MQFGLSHWGAKRRGDKDNQGGGGGSLGELWVGWGAGGAQGVGTD